jgi:hypothetical protein
MAPQVLVTPRSLAHSLKEDCGHQESSAPSAPRSPRKRNPRARTVFQMRHDHQDAHRASPQRGTRLRGADVLPAVQPSLLHPGRPLVLLGEDGPLIGPPDSPCPTRRGGRNGPRYYRCWKTLFSELLVSRLLGNRASGMRSSRKLSALVDGIK